MSKYQLYAEIKSLWNGAPSGMLEYFYQENYIGKDRQDNYVLFDVETYTYHDVAFIFCKLQKPKEAEREIRYVR